VISAAERVRATGQLRTMRATGTIKAGVLALAIAATSPGASAQQGVVTEDVRAAIELRLH
jgi:hypothetical protein